ncbi:MAG: type II toxin-antitoxin system VapC family toxin [Actinomycetota bacterium]
MLLDTNVLLRYRQHSSAAHVLCRTAIERLENQGRELCLCTQNLIEYWAVATRPVAQNGFGLLHADVDRDLADFEQGFEILTEPADVLRWWRALVNNHGVTGRQVHDARLVALMQAHGIRHLLTLNPADFTRYPVITVIQPQHV